MDRRVDRERGGVDGTSALDHLTLVVDQDEVRHSHVTETHPEGVHPEVVGQLRVACRDVAGDALGEAEAAEEPQRTGQLLLAVEAFLFERGERWWGQLCEDPIGQPLTLTFREVFRCFDHVHKLIVWPGPTQPQNPVTSRRPPRRCGTWCRICPPYPKESGRLLLSSSAASRRTTCAAATASPGPRRCS